MPTETLEFEESLAPLLKEVDALSALPRTDARERELERLNQKLRAARAEIYGKLTPWQRVLVPVIQAAPTCSITSIGSSPISWRCTATADSQTTTPS